MSFRHLRQAAVVAFVLLSLTGFQSKGWSHSGSRSGSRSGTHSRSHSGSHSSSRSGVSRSVRKSRTGGGGGCSSNRSSSHVGTGTTAHSGTRSVARHSPASPTTSRSTRKPTVTILKCADGKGISQVRVDNTGGVADTYVVGMDFLDSAGMSVGGGAQAVKLGAGQIRTINVPMDDVSLDNGHLTCKVAYVD